MKILDFKTVKKSGGGVPLEYYLWVDEALKCKNEFVMPPKTRINQENGNYYAVMSCLHEKSNLAMVKMIGRHSLKVGEKRPVMMSDLLLYESGTGVLKALMDAEYITTLRTGASAAHSAILYGRDGFDTIGLIGLGNIMTVCAVVLFSKIDNRRITVKLYKYHDHEKRFMERFKDYSNLNFVLCDTYEETVENSDIIISAVTNVTENFCADECFCEGCTVIPIMTRGFMNCDLFFDKVFTDEIEQIKGFKYFNSFKSVANTSDVLNGIAVGRTSDKERILVYNYGLAIQDLYFAEKILNMSKDGENEIEYSYCTDKFFM